MCCLTAFSLCLPCQLGSMSASLGSVLSEVSNETIVVNDVVTLDLERKWVLYVEENATAESAVGFQKVPRDFNIFVLLNISSYSQDIEGWQVVLEKDSRKYEVFNSLFQVMTMKNKL